MSICIPRHFSAISAATIISAVAPAVLAGSVTVPGDAPTIQQGVQIALQQGATEVVVAPGVYAERVEFLGGLLTIRSTDGPAATTIDATGLGGAAISIDGVDGAALEGFTVTGGVDSGIRIIGSTVELLDCVVTGNSGLTGGGLSVLQSTIGINDVSFTGNIATNSGGAAAFLASSVTGGGIDASGNTANQLGGGLYGSSVTLDINGLDLSDNGTVTDIGHNSFNYQTLGGGGPISLIRTAFSPTRASHRTRPPTGAACTSRAAARSS